MHQRLLQKIIACAGGNSGRDLNLIANRKCSILNCSFLASQDVVMNGVLGPQRNYLEEHIGIVAKFTDDRS